MTALFSNDVQQDPDPDGGPRFIIRKRKGPHGVRTTRRFLGIPEHLQDAEDVHLVPEWNWDFFTDHIEDLQETAKELGTGGAEYEVVDEVDARVYRTPVADGALQDTGRVVKARFIRVHGEPPSLEGWTFLAAVDHDHEEEGADVIRVAPGTGDVDLSEYRDRGPVCDHCETTRRRDKTLVVEHEDGERRQVGTTCVQDFLGHQSPDRVLRFAQALYDVEAKFRALGQMEGFQHIEPRFDTPAFLTVTAQAVREFGWTSKSSQDRSTPTALVVKRNLEPTMDVPDDQVLEEPPTDGDVRLAEEARAWARNLTPDSEYEANIQRLADQDSFQAKHAGYVASIIRAYQREQADPEPEDEPESEWVGEEGERVEDLEVKVEHWSTYESQYGDGKVFKFETRDGNRLVWFTSSDPYLPGYEPEDRFDDHARPLTDHDLDIDGWLQARATVKEHTTYNGEKETVVKRVHLED